MKRILLTVILAATLSGARLPHLPPATVHFQTGPEAKALMDVATTYQFPWNRFSVCTASCQTNETFTISPGLTMDVFSPLNIAYPGSDGGMTAFQYVDLHFSNPVSGFGLDLEDAYRFNWLVGLEAFGQSGDSLGKIEQSGFTQSAHPPFIYFSALSDSNVISAIRIYTNYFANAPESDIFNVGVASIAQAFPSLRFTPRDREKEKAPE